MKIREYLQLQYFLLSRLFSGGKHTAPSSGSIADQFHRYYYDQGTVGGTWYDTRWLGQRLLKCPFDLWVYQEILFETKPSLIIETGTFEGGSAYYLATLCDLIGRGRIITIDVKAQASRPEHPRIEYWAGSSTDPDIVRRLKSATEGQHVMLILDSDHRRAHVADELRTLSPLVSKGAYLVVEDTSLNGHPLVPEFGPGPMEAVTEFLKDRTDFDVDRSREKFYMTFNPSGYLRRRA